MRFSWLRRTRELVERAALVLAAGRDAPRVAGDGRPHPGGAVAAPLSASHDEGGDEGHNSARKAVPAWA